MWIGEPMGSGYFDCVVREGGYRIGGRERQRERGQEQRGMNDQRLKESIK